MTTIIPMSVNVPMEEFQTWNGPAQTAAASPAGLTWHVTGANGTGSTAGGEWDFWTPEATGWGRFVEGPMFHFKVGSLPNMLPYKDGRFVPNPGAFELRLGLTWSDDFFRVRLAGGARDAGDTAALGPINWRFETDNGSFQPYDPSTPYFSWVLEDGVMRSMKGSAPYTGTELATMPDNWYWSSSGRYGPIPRFSAYHYGWLNYASGTEPTPYPFDLHLDEVGFTWDEHLEPIPTLYGQGEWNAAALSPPVFKLATARWDHQRYDLAGHQSGGAGRFMPV